MDHDLFVPQHLFGIIGHPLGHSLSPLLHNWAFRRTGFPGAYLAWPTPPERLDAFIDAVRAVPIAGLSVTIPHKEAVVPLLDGCTATARAVGAVNTVYRLGGQLVGENTDVAGFVRPLRELYGERGPDTVLVLGAGGAARAVLAGLRDLGAGRIVVANRDLGRAERLAAGFGAEAVAWEERVSVRASLLVNTTPLGMAGKGLDATPFPREFFEPGQVAYDLVYNPHRTRFLREAEAAGCRTVGGLEMFLGQGAEQFRLWTGGTFPLDEARDLLAQHLG